MMGFYGWYIAFYEINKQGHVLDNVEIIGEKLLYGNFIKI